MIFLQRNKTLLDILNKELIMNNISLKNEENSDDVTSQLAITTIAIHNSSLKKPSKYVKLVSNIVLEPNSIEIV